MLYVLQGPPGGGKSTLAQRLAFALEADGCRVVICSTDAYHFDPDGRWSYKPARIGEYHQFNIANARKYMNLGYDVIVDNTNIKAWEAKPYVEHAVKSGIGVVFMRVDGGFASEHGVPQERIDAMRAGMENLSVKACLEAFAPWDVKEYQI